ncbi:MAG: HAMP domain-containing protein [Gammaproteobacteria bacterium]|nr:HAMP domain-containing protein [Gammaproteobacteria bacterium]
MSSSGNKTEAQDADFSKKSIPQAELFEPESARRSFFDRHIPIAIKLAIAIGILLTIAMSMLGALIVNNQTQLLNRQIHSTGRTVVQQMAESAKELLLANDVLQLEILAYNLGTSENIIGTAIYSTDLKLLASSGQNPFQSHAPYENKKKSFFTGSPKTLEWQMENSTKGQLDAISFMSPVHFKDLTAGHVLISFSRNGINQAIHEVVRSIITVTALLIIIGIIISYLLGKRLTRPIQHLLDASRAIDEGQYDIQLTSQRNDEIGYLMNSLNNMAHGMIQKEQVEAAFNRHVSPNIAKEILSNLDEVKLGGTHVFSTVLFVDIVGFTATSESLAPQAVAELLNEFYSYVTHSVHLFKGTIDKYIGDCAMVVFGVPEPDEDHVYHAIAYAVFLQRMTKHINKIRAAQNKPPIHYRIGINCGEMLAGNMGSSTRMQYTVVGDSVNLASRLAAIADTDQIMISEETYMIPNVKRRIIAQKYQSLSVRGKIKPVSTYLVHDVREAEQIKIEKLIDQLMLSMEQESE